MSTLENIGINKVKLSFAVDAAEFEKGLQHAYNEIKGKINLSGFRKGKVPRKVVEKFYGKEILFDDAINFVLRDAYANVLEELNVEAVSKPQIDVEKVSVEEGVSFTAEVTTYPMTDIDGYMALTYKPYDEEPTDEEINERINADLEKNSRLITVDDRPAQLKDTVVIDFEGFVDGEAFDGGKSEDYELVLGTHSFIDTFEDQIAGHSTGDEFDVNVMFPEAYHAPALAGKPALFKVKLKEIKFKELPEQNDEFAQDVSEFDTLDEYRNDIITKLRDNKKRNAEADKQNQIVEQLMEKLVAEIPEVMYEDRTNELLDNMARDAQRYYNLKFEDYLRMTGQTEETIRENLKKTAEFQVKSRMALLAVGKKEGFEITDAERFEAYKNMVMTYGGPDAAERISEADMEYVNKKELDDDILVQRALKLVTDSAVAM